MPNDERFFDMAIKLQTRSEYFLKKAWGDEITKLPLAEQCRQLDIAHENLDGLPYGKKPEIDALNHFTDQGFVGTYCEGQTILLLIKAAALDILTQLSPKRFPPKNYDNWRDSHIETKYRISTPGLIAPVSREHACIGATQGQLEVYKEDSDLILNAIRNADVDQIVRHFQEIYMFPRAAYHCPGVTAGMISSMFTAIGGERLTMVVKRIGAKRHPLPLH